MKTQQQYRRKQFVKHVIDKGILSKIHRLLSNLNNKKVTQSKKWAKDLNDTSARKIINEN